MMGPEQNSAIIRQLALEAGFLACGFSKAEKLEDESYRMEKWLNAGYQGQMKYLENHFEKRMDPRLLVPGSKTVVSLLYNYFPVAVPSENELKIAKYAYGEDYHHIVKDKLKILVERIREKIGDVEGRAFVDSAPVMERAWAEKSGLGWIGKHGLLIRKQEGSFFFLAELIIDLECAADHIVTDHCGSCTRCVDACPTDAILPDKTLNASRCISYLTIELKDRIPEEFQGKTSGWIFGCDICQDVCPWNRFSQPASEPAFMPSDPLMHMSREQWIDLSREVFSDLFSKSAVQRTGYDGLMRNIRFSAITEEADNTEI